MIEKWEPIQGYESLYEVSNLGNVKSLSKVRGCCNGGEKILKQQYAKSGYMIVGLCKNGKMKSFNVHKLVAKAFIPNFNNKPQINHIDGNKCNNKVDNLEWCTVSENVKHAYDNNLKKGAWVGQKDGKHPNSRKVAQYNKEMILIKIWDSMSEAHRETGVFVDSISKCCKKIYKTAGGYIWEYVN